MFSTLVFHEWSRSPTDYLLKSDTDEIDLRDNQRTDFVITVESFVIDKRFAGGRPALVWAVYRVYVRIVSRYLISKLRVRNTFVSFYVVKTNKRNNTRIRIFRGIFFKICKFEKKRSFAEFRVSPMGFVLRCYRWR